MLTFWVERGNANTSKTTRTAFAEEMARLSACMQRHGAECVVCVAPYRANINQAMAACDLAAPKWSAAWSRIRLGIKAPRVYDIGALPELFSAARKAAMWVALECETLMTPYWGPGIPTAVVDAIEEARPDAIWPGFSRGMTATNAELFSLTRSPIYGVPDDPDVRRHAQAEIILMQAQGQAAAPMIHQNIPGKPGGWIVGDMWRWLDAHAGDAYVWIPGGDSYDFDARVDAFYAAKPKPRAKKVEREEPKTKRRGGK